MSNEPKTAQQINSPLCGEAMLFDGGPPQKIWIGEVVQNDRCTLRDQLAMAALQGLIARHDEEKDGPLINPVNPWYWFAEESYKAADAMLAARIK